MLGNFEEDKSNSLEARKHALYCLILLLDSGCSDVTSGTHQRQYHGDTVPWRLHEPRKVGDDIGCPIFPLDDSMDAVRRPELLTECGNVVVS